MPHWIQPTGNSNAFGMWEEAGLGRTHTCMMRTFWAWDWNLGAPCSFSKFLLSETVTNHTVLSIAFLVKPLQLE